MSSLNAAPSEDGVMSAALLLVISEVFVMLEIDLSGTLGIDLAIEELDRFDQLSARIRAPGTPWDRTASDARAKARARLTSMRAILSAMASAPVIEPAPQ